MMTVAIRSVFDPERSPALPASISPGAPPRPAMLAGPLEDAIAASLRRWRGRSGRLYLVGVHRLDRCPDYRGAVLLAVDSASGACLWAGEAQADGARQRAALAAAGADEVHVHLLAESDAARAAAIEDLAPDGPALQLPGWTPCVDGDAGRA